MLIRTPQEDIERVLFTREQIAARVAALGTELTRRLNGERPIMVCILKGAAFFFADLCRAMACDVDTDFLSVSSYGTAATSSGAVRLVRDLSQDVSGRRVVLVEDVIDSGLTMQYLRNLFAQRKAAEVITVSFLDKANCHPPKHAADLLGFSVGDEFLVGYGLDYAEHYRNLPDVGVLRSECYAETESV